MLSCGLLTSRLSPECPQTLPFPFLLASLTPLRTDGATGGVHLLLFPPHTLSSALEPQLSLSLSPSSFEI